MQLKLLYFLTEWNTYIAAIFLKSVQFFWDTPHSDIIISLSFWAWEIEQPCIIFLEPDQDN